MPKSEIRQFEKLVTDSEHILVLLPENPRGDHFSAALALAHFCDLQSIKTTIAFNDPYEQVSLFGFLPKPTGTKITHSISGTRDLVLSFNTKYNKILDVKTEVLPNELKIYVTPAKGMIDSRDFSFLPGKYPFDTIVTLGATDKESMGKLYEEIPDIFYELPIINIDNKNANEQFGQVNIINNIASSVSEIIAEIFEKVQENNLSQNCAQCLLTGIISETNSFQNNKTTPNAMTLSSKLIELGASQQIIIQNLYRNLPFSLLKLWGRAMKNFTTSKYNDKSVLSSLTYKDIEQTGAKKNHIHAILKKMKENYPSGKVFILFYENEKGDLIALFDMTKSNTSIDASITKNALELPNKTYKLKLLSKTIPEATEEVCNLLTPYTNKLK